MLNRLKSFLRRHKALTVVFLAVGVPVILIVIYASTVVARAYIDSPKVVKTATEPEKIKLKLEELTPDRERILLAVEDPNFYTHNGIDLSTPGAGWTTITQGIVKVYFYNGFTPGLFRYRKFEQSIIAYVFNREVDKKTQLLIFLNSAYFGDIDGREVIGFADAANVYFNKAFPALSREEYISLVATLVAPNNLNIRRQPAENQERVRRIERLLNGECRPGGYEDVYFEGCKLN